MFSLMDKVASGIEPMLKDLEDHILSAGLADMVASAESITSVSHPHRAMYCTSWGGGG
jgi:cullin-5